MNLRALVHKAGFEVRTGDEQLDREVTGGYASDMLSDVIAHSKPGDLWVTLQTHENTVAVAVLRELAGIVLIGGRVPENETIAKAKDQGVPILLSPHRTFEVVGRLIEAGVPQRNDA